VEAGGNHQESSKAPQGPIRQGESQQEQEPAEVLRITAPPVGPGRGELAGIEAKDFRGGAEGENTGQALQ